MEATDGRTMIGDGGDELFARARFYEAREEEGGGLDDWRSERVEAARRGAAVGKRARRKKRPNAQSAFHNSRFLPPFLPSFSPRYPPSRLPLHCFPFLFLSRPPSASARLVLIRARVRALFLVAKKLGYFATFHVDKLRLAQSVLGGREAAEAQRAARQPRGIRSVQGSISSRSLSLSLSSHL